MAVNGASAVIDSGLQTQINTYLTALNTGSWTGIGTGKATNYTFTNYTFTIYNSATSQTLVSVAAVPKPSSLALAGLALFGLALFGLALFGVVYTRRKTRLIRADTCPTDGRIRTSEAAHVAAFLFGGVDSLSLLRQSRIARSC